MLKEWLKGKARRDRAHRLVAVMCQWYLDSLGIIRMVEVLDIISVSIY